MSAEDVEKLTLEEQEDHSKEEEEEGEEESVDLGDIPPVIVEYCEVCTLPVEYREFSSMNKSKKGGTESESAEASSAAGEEAAGDTVEDAAKGKKKGKSKSKGDSEEIVVTRNSRGKKKFVTTVSGLKRVYGLDLKKTAKAMAGKFASSCSVTGDDDIQAQGDRTDDMISFLTSKYPEIDEAKISVVLGK